jgi:fatty acid desaturase
MTDIANSELWLWALLALYVLPPAIIVARGIARSHSLGAIARLAAFFAFVSLLAAIGAGVLLYYLHSVAPFWLIGAGVAILAFFQPFTQTSTHTASDDRERAL